jgi:hypothetical protein
MVAARQRLQARKEKSSKALNRTGLGNLGILLPRDIITSNLLTLILNQLHNLPLYFIAPFSASNLFAAPVMP